MIYDINELCDQYLPFLVDKGFYIKKSDDNNRLILMRRDLQEFLIKDIEDDLIPFLELINKLELIFYNRMLFFDYNDGVKKEAKFIAIEDLINGLDDKATCTGILISINQ